MPKSKSTSPQMKKKKGEDTIEISLGNHLGQSETWQYSSKKDFEHQNVKKWGNFVSRESGKKQKVLISPHRPPKAPKGAHRSLKVPIGPHWPP